MNYLPPVREASEAEHLAIRLASSNRTSRWTCAPVPAWAQDHALPTWGRSNRGGREAGGDAGRTAAWAVSIAAVFDELQQRYPAQFSDGQIRTLQRHIQVWRARTVLTIGDDSWFDAGAETGSSLPPPLRVSVDLADDAEQSARANSRVQTPPVTARVTPRRVLQWLHNPARYAVARHRAAAPSIA